MSYSNEAQQQEQGTLDLIQECQRLNDEISGLISCYLYHDEILTTEAMILVQQVKSLLHHEFDLDLKSNSHKPHKHEEEIESMIRTGKFFEIE